MDEDEIVKLFVQTQAVAFTSEIARRRRSEQGEEEKEKSTALNINDLPDIMMLQIFNFLTPSDLVKTSQVCRMWNNLSEDELLWRGFLKRDIHKWQMINHSLNPEVFSDPDILNFKDPEGKFSCKQIYWSCKPKKNGEEKEEEKPASREDIFSRSLSSLWNFMAKKKMPKVVLFGSGLNSLKGGRKLLGVILGVSSRQASSEFKVTGLVPGGNSVGAGISIEFRGVEFTLITVYNSSKAEREASPDGFEFGRLLIRNFTGDSNSSSRESSPPVVDPVAAAAAALSVSSAASSSKTPSSSSPSSSSSSSTSHVAKLAPIFHKLFDDADAFVYVTDSCRVAVEDNAVKQEAEAEARRKRGFPDPILSPDIPVTNADPDVIRRPWEDELGILMPPHSHSKTLVAKAAPLLVLACRNSKHMSTDGDENKFASAFEIVQTFQKKYLLTGRPWQVNSVDICEASGVSDGFQWIVNRCR